MVLSRPALFSLGVGFALCAIAYVLWGPDRLFRRKGRCPGLVNLGNTCFLNAVLQAIASMSAVQLWVRSASERHRGRRLAKAISHTTAVLSEGGGEGVHSPSEVMRALVWHRWTIDFKQQDAHELYHVLLTTLDEEACSFSGDVDGLAQLLPEKTVSSDSALRGVSWVWEKTGKVFLPPVLDRCPLEGMLSSRLTCCHCQYSFPVKYEHFDSISLPLPRNRSSCSLDMCLSEYVKQEMVYDVECPQCSKASGGASVRRVFLKQLQLGRLPRCLCVHLQRTVWLPSGETCKNGVHLTFPLSLNTAAITSTTTSHSGYHQLCAVIEHRGGPWSGHYGTYRRLPPQPSSSSSSSCWVYTSDETVYSISVREVLQAQAYMLFYQRTNKTV